MTPVATPVSSPMNPMYSPSATNTRWTAPSSAPIALRMAISRAFSVAIMIKVETMENEATRAMKVRTTNMAIFSRRRAMKSPLFSSSQDCAS